ncbi:MAG: ABC transporter ATP-binding protein [Lachnospiraceae bacterium]|nr:ABC transporter ATP-binding protein [Lachnospiraceae bacterium]
MPKIQKPTGTESLILRKVLRYVRRYRLLILLSVLLSAAVTALSLYLPIMQGQSIDLILGKGRVNMGGLMQILFVMGLSILLTSLAQWFQNLINNRVTYHVVKDLRNDAFRKIQRLPLSYLDSHPSGDIISRVTTDADQFAEGLLMGFTQLFSGVLTILGTLILLFTINGIMALLVLVLTPVSLFAARFISSHTYSFFKSQSEIRGEQTALIDEMISGRKVLQAYSRQEQVGQQFDEINQRLQHSSLYAVYYSSLTNPCTRFVNSLVYAVAACCGALLALSGRITVGQLTSALSYANQYTKPFNEISGVITELQNSIACAGRLLELIELPEMPADPPVPESIEVYRGAVDLENISFSYTPEQKLIENFSLHVVPGTKVAIVGPTGCGKTTLINLLMRFYDVNSGDILLEGKSIYSLKRSDLRNGFGMVLQDTWIKETTVRENIAMGRPDATLEEIREAARSAHADGFICRLPKGYDTVLGKDVELSEGQRQLICIARVMLTLPPVLILDEATSSIDSRTEMRIQRAFDKMTTGRTSFVVAHRLSTIRSADMILVMKDGHIVETGNHDQLMARGGFYTTLYNSQFASV